MAIRTWKGYVNATSETPITSELNLKTGSLVTIVSNGEASICKVSVEFPTVGPTGIIKPILPLEGIIAPNANQSALLIKTGDIYTPIGGGLIDWPIPNDNNLEFVLNDIPNGYHDNFGGFWVTVKYDNRDLLS